ncbi:hypothetical protein OROHE_013077 [Orobanche hederae]
MTHQAAESATLDVPLTKRDLYLDELGIGVTGTIVVMVCRVWDVIAVTGRYLSTDFIVYDSKILFRFLYSVNLGIVLFIYVKTGVFLYDGQRAKFTNYERINIYFL